MRRHYIATSVIGIGSLQRFACVLATLSGIAMAVAVPASAQITTFPVPGSVGANLNGLSLGPDGNMWFTDTGKNRIGVITPSGTITEYPITTASAGALRIQPGADGNMWFDELAVNKIAKITIGGTVTEYQVPTPNSAPIGIWAGPDGNIWFPEHDANKIAKITPGGTFTEYPIPTAAAGARGLGPGPDGAMWFTEEFANKIGRITTSGTITEFPIPTPNSVPRSIKSGPDGALWFAEHDANKIARITTAGVVTEFPIPTSNSKPGYLREGRDGALWFIENNNNKIGRITTAGVITEYAIPNAIVADAIAPGPDGNLWFTAELSAGGSTIGYITPPALTSPLFASVLPTSRSVQVGSPATVFATIINAGNSAVNGCAIAPVGDISGNFLYQTTNPNTNALTGTSNTPASIAAGQLQTFLIAITPNAPNTSTDLQIGFACSNVAAAGTIVGINTLKLTFDANPVADMIAVGVTPSNDGFSRTGGPAGTGVFAVATANVGAATSLTASARLTDSSIALAVTLCETNSSAQCKAAPGAVVTRSFAHNENATFSVFLQASGTIAADPARFRVFLEFKDSGGVVRGSTSTAVTTQ